MAMSGRFVAEVDSDDEFVIVGITPTGKSINSSLILPTLDAPIMENVNLEDGKSGIEEETLPAKQFIRAKQPPLSKSDAKRTPYLYGKYIAASVVVAVLASFVTVGYHMNFAAGSKRNSGKPIDMQLGSFRVAEISGYFPLQVCRVAMNTREERLPNNLTNICLIRPKVKIISSMAQTGHMQYAGWFPKKRENYLCSSKNQAQAEFKTSFMALYISFLTTITRCGRKIPIACPVQKNQPDTQCLAQIRRICLEASKLLVGRDAKCTFIY